MSIDRISATDERLSFKNKILGSTTVGATFGGIYSAFQKNWLYKGMPSDSFVRTVSTNLGKDMSSDELKESFKINKFLADAVNPVTDVESLKDQIRGSEELSEAIKISPEEGVEDAITRIYSQPKDKIRQDLINLQLKTKTDKKNSVSTALRLITENYDASGRRLAKNPNTPETTFNMIKTTAKRLQLKSVVIGTALAGLGAGALALVVSKVPDSDNK